MSTQTPNSAGGSSTAQNGAGSANADPRAVLAQMMAQRDLPADSQSNDPVMSSAQDDPENPTAQPAPAEQPGQDTLPGDGGAASPDEGEGVAENGENDSSDGSDAASGSNDDAVLSEALKGLNADARKHLLEMANAVAKGETSLGELKRGHKLNGQYGQQIEDLRREIADLKSGAVKVDEPQPAKAGLTSVQSLKSVQEVNARIEFNERVVNQLEKVVRRNPGLATGESVQIGDRQYTLDDIEGMIDNAKAELKALPARSAEITQQRQFSDQQKTARAQVVQAFPELEDPDHATAKAVQAKLKANPFLNNFASPEWAAMVWLEGEKALNARIAGRNGQAKGNGQAVVAKPVGKVPLGKPHVAQGGATARVNGSALSGKAALELVKKDSSRSSLANLIAATGR